MTDTILLGAPNEGVYMLITSLPISIEVNALRETIASIAKCNYTLVRMLSIYSTTIVHALIWMKERDKISEVYKSYTNVLVYPQSANPALYEYFYKNTSLPTTAVFATLTEIPPQPSWFNKLRIQVLHISEKCDQSQENPRESEPAQKWKQSRLAHNNSRLQQYNENWMRLKQEHLHDHHQHRGYIEEQQQQQQQQNILINPLPYRQLGNSAQQSPNQMVPGTIRRTGNQ